MPISAFWTDVLSATIAALFAVIIVYLAQRLWSLRLKKILCYDAKNNRSVLSRPMQKAGVELLFNGKKVYQASQGFVEFCNGGNVDLKSADFDGDIVVQLGSVGQVIEHAVWDENGDVLPVEVSVEGSSVHIKPFLLKKKQSFRLHYSLLEDSHPWIKVQARLEEGKVVEKVPYEKTLWGQVNPKMPILKAGGYIFLWLTFWQIVGHFFPNVLLPG